MPKSKRNNKQKTKTCTLGGDGTKRSDHTFDWSCTSVEGAVCKRCKSFACYACVGKLLETAKKVCGKQHYAKSAFCVEMETALKCKKEHFEVCHACWIDKANIRQKVRDDIQRCGKKGSPMTGDGMLFLPQFNLLIDSPLITHNVVDVHCLGKEGEVPPAHHCVLSSRTAMVLGKAQAQPMPMVKKNHPSKTIRRTCVTVSVKDYLDPNIQQDKLRIDLIVIDCDENAEIPENGSSDCSVERFKKLTSFTINDRMKQSHCTIILGKWKNIPTHSLLLCRFYYFYPNLPGRNIIDGLYSAITECIDESRLVHNRTDGSSGVYEEPTWQLLAMMNTINAPRIGRGLFFVPRRTDIVVCHIDSRGEPTWRNYSVPRDGGRFENTASFLNKHPLVCALIESKICAAMILQSMSTPVVPVAVATEIESVRRARESAQSVLEAEPYRDLRLEVLFQYARRNTNLMIQHPVGLHSNNSGTFDEGVAALNSFQARNCFPFKAKFTKLGVGRGGAGPGGFVFSLVVCRNGSQDAAVPAECQEAPSDDTREYMLDQLSHRHRNGKILRQV